MSACTGPVRIIMIMSRFSILRQFDASLQDTTRPPMVSSTRIRKLARLAIRRIQSPDWSRPIATHDQTFNRGNRKVFYSLQVEGWNVLNHPPKRNRESSRSSINCALRLKSASELSASVGWELSGIQETSRPAATQCRQAQPQRASARPRWKPRRDRSKGGLTFLFFHPAKLI